MNETNEYIICLQKIKQLIDELENYKSDLREVHKLLFNKSKNLMLKYFKHYNLDTSYDLNIFEYVNYSKTHFNYDFDSFQIQQDLQNEDFLKAFGGKHIFFTTLYFFYEINVLKFDKKLVDNYGNPFLPMILIFLTGGKLIKHSGFYQIDNFHVDFKISTISDDLPVHSLSFLTYLIKKGYKNELIDVNKIYYDWSNEKSLSNNKH